MGYKELNIKLPTGYSDEQLKHKIACKLKLHNLSFQIINKSLDARKKNNIHWLLKVGINSPELPENRIQKDPVIEIKYKKRNKNVFVTGCGPAGFFAAYLLQKSGFDSIIVERGAEVNKRANGIFEFEKTGNFNPVCNYAFGEGGAGTFSDGKLTSRSKNIVKEREFIISCYIAAGAPKEISYMAHPHIGSDNLRKVVQKLREEYIISGGKIYFETILSDMVIVNKTIKEAIAGTATFKADHFIIAPGHSSYETYQMLIKKGIQFRTKNFAIGSRVEHKQEIINKAQWGIEKLQGVKAAEYRLTSEGNGDHRVYTFCMCPGGIVVPATAYKHSNIVNGMSYYQRNGQFANAACVSGIHPDQLAGRKTKPIDALKELELLERSFYEYSKGYKAPYCTIIDFITGKGTVNNSETSYPLGITPAPLWEMLPSSVVKAMQVGLRHFINKIKGYETGILLGLESKTSSPVQAIRDKSGLCEGFKNLYVIGEGSGYAGGIISSAADGIKVALNIINQSD